MNVQFFRLHSSLRYVVMFTVFMIGIAPKATRAQYSPEPVQKPLSVEDYGKWESVRGVKFSDDGKWISTITGNNDGDRHLTLLQQATGEKVEFKNVNGVTFSPDNNWVLLRRTLPGKEMKKVRDARGTVEPRAWLYHMYTRDTVKADNLDKYHFSTDGRFLAMTKTEDRGRSLIIRDMRKGEEMSFGNVTSFIWSPDSNVLVFLVEGQKGPRQIQLYNAETGQLKVLDSNEEKYTRMEWVKRSDALLLVKQVDDERFKEPTHEIAVIRDPGQKNQSKAQFQPHKEGVIPEGVSVLDSDIELSENADRVYMKVVNRNQASSDAVVVIGDTTTVSNAHNTASEKPVYHNKHHKAPDLQIWHSKDKVIIPAQKESGIDGLETPKTAVWDFKTEEFHILQEEFMEGLIVKADASKFLAYDETPYERDNMFGRHYYDVYLVDSESGDDQKLVEKVSKFYELGPEGRYFVYLKNDLFYLYDIRLGMSQELTKSLDVSFIDHHNDHPLPQKPAFGFVGWAKGGKSFLLNSTYDVWQFFTDGRSPRALTSGTSEEIIYRVDSSVKSDGGIDLSQILVYTMEGKWTKKTGYASAKAGRPVKTLIYEDASIKRKALHEPSGKVVFSRTSFDMPGNVYLTGKDFDKEEQLTFINAFQDEYQWSRAELVEYTNALGNKAQGILYYPADYKKGEQYPMITYIYEKLSHGYHNYIQPNERSYYNTALWVQSGYFVFKPDIEFEAGNPGVSSARTLEKAVAAVIEKGDVDADKVGLIGHSWGGYQAGFVPTQTDIFAASVAGAGLTNLISMNLAITPAFGWKPENDHFEVGQERMEVAPWEAPQQYIDNSSVMQVDKLNTPVMFAVGDNDKNVNWSQGVEYYNAARRAGKDFVMLVYKNEGHGISKEHNQIDYQQRILKWFGYHLKGEAPEDWMLGGVPYTEQQQRLKSWSEE